MAKKLRRKELKKPDEFVTQTVRVGQWLRDHQRVVTFSAIAVVVVVIAVATTVHFTAQSKISSSETLWEAMDVSVSPLEEDFADNEDVEPPAGYKTFDSTEARAKAASKAYQAVADEHGGTGPGQAAKLGLATSFFVQGEYEKARDLYDNFISDSGGLDSLKAVAHEGLGYCYEAADEHDKALAQFRELESIEDGRHRDLAQYHQGRMLEKLSKNNDAAELYRAIVQRSEQASDDAAVNGFIRDRAESRLAVIDPTADVLKGRSKRRSPEALRELLRKAGARGAGMPGAGMPGPPPSP